MDAFKEIIAEKQTYFLKFLKLVIIYYKELLSEEKGLSLYHDQQNEEELDFFLKLITFS